MTAGPPPASPATLARLAGRRRSTEYSRPAHDPSFDVEELDAVLRGSRGEIVWLLERVGCPSTSDLLARWCQNAGDANVDALLRDRLSPSGVAQMWQDHTRGYTRGRQSGVAARPKDDDSPNILAMLVLERELSVSAGQIAPVLPGAMTWDKTIHVCRQHTGIALYEHAREVNWRKPIVFTRTLRLAREYFRSVVLSEHLTKPESRNQFLGKLGVATALASRFETVTREDLEEARDSVRRSMGLGNPSRDALPYLLEIQLRIYDLSGDRSDLVRMMTHDVAPVSSRADLPALFHLNTAEAWLRLADVADSDAGRRTFLDKVAVSLERASLASRSDLLDRVREAVLQGILIVMNARVTPGDTVRGLRNPFGLQEYLLDPRRETVAGDLAESIVAELRVLIGARGEPLERRVLADALSAAAKLPGPIWAARADLLTEAVETRGQGVGRGPLDDEGSRLRNLSDLLEQSTLTGRVDSRRTAIRGLLEEAWNSPGSCIPLVLLARDLERSGPAPGLPVQWPPEYADWRSWCDAGDATRFYQESAERAFGSHEVRRRHLGGRSGALTTEDYLSFSNDTFVFKATTRTSLERESARTGKLERYLAERGLAGCGVVEHIADVGIEPPTAAGSDTLAVRRFRRGTVIAELARTTPERTGHLLSRAAGFLGVIHASELADCAEPIGLRRSLRSAELGRWLRAVVPDAEKDSFFDSWWGAVSGLPATSRRDAHLFNWLLTDDDVLLAIDLEATGWRPIGYELAQLTDDVPVLGFGESDWAIRDAVVDHYRSVLSQHGVDFGEPDLRHGYRAALVARAVRLLSDPGGNDRLRSHGEGMLQFLGQDDTSAVGDLARLLLSRWATRRGVSLSLITSTVGESRRRRISRALAYQLRHNRELVSDRDGWVGLSDVVARLTEAGVNVSEDQLASVASSIDERRFEVRGDRVRALYGHSVGVEIEYEAATEPTELFHATSIDSLNSILQGREGLRPMERISVHLSADKATAAKASRRRAGPILLRVRGTDQEIAHAGGSTWLATAVPSDAIEVVPISEIFADELRSRGDVVLS